MSTRRAPCPQCDRGPRDTALAVYDDGASLYCHRCQWWRRHWIGRCHRVVDGLPCDGEMDMTSEPGGTTGQCRRCGLSGAGHHVTPAAVRTTARTEPLDWSTTAEAIWRRSQGLRDTLGETYLLHRGCVLPPRDSHLRFLPGDGRYPPSLVAAITDVRSAKPISLHFTRMAADGHGKAGTDRDKLLLAGHRKRGGCIRLWPDEAVTHGLALAEGIETALAAAHAFIPVWATIDCSGLSVFPVLGGIEALTIFADADDAGIEAAAECATRWNDAGKEVLLVLPSEVNTDVNDEVLR